MRVIWTALGVCIFVLGVALSMRWAANDPSDIQLQDVKVGPISRFSATNPYPSDPDVVRISFTSRDDFRATALAQRVGGLGPLLVPCACNGTAPERRGAICEKGLTNILFDGSGYINSSNTNFTTSKAGAADRPARYYLLVPLTPSEAQEVPYDLVQHPTDLCLQIVRESLFGTYKSNMIRISKASLVAAQTSAANAAESAKITKELGLKPLTGARKEGGPDLPKIDLSDRH